MRQSYRGAGVDIDAGAALVEAIKPLAKATARTGATASLGGFGALFDLKAAGFRDPILVSTTDGVGTKLMIAQAIGRHDTVGIDLVAMCVNDLIVQGAEPLFFLDYFAHRQARERSRRNRSWRASRRPAATPAARWSVARPPSCLACTRPASTISRGFAVGAAERDRVLDGNQVAVGDIVLGLASTGAHSNGFSLVRRIVEQSGLFYDAPAPFAPGQTLGDALLTPTRLYVKSCLAAIKSRRRSRVGAYHRRRIAGEHPARAARWLRRRDRCAAVETAAGVRLADATRRRRCDGDGAHLQLRDRHGADRRA